MTAFRRFLISPILVRTSVGAIGPASGRLVERGAAVDAFRVALLGDPAAGGAFLELDPAGPADGLVLLFERRIAIRAGAALGLVLVGGGARRRGRGPAGLLVLVVLDGLVEGVGPEVRAVHLVLGQAAELRRDEIVGDRLGLGQRLAHGHLADHAGDGDGRA